MKVGDKVAQSPVGEGVITAIENEYKSCSSVSSYLPQVWAIRSTKSR